MSSKAHLDFHACFFIGDINRADLIARFGVNSWINIRSSSVAFHWNIYSAISSARIYAAINIKQAAAIRGLATYHELTPDNFDYDTKAKIYRYSSCLNPCLSTPPTRSWLYFHKILVRAWLAKCSLWWSVKAAPYLINRCRLHVLTELTCVMGCFASTITLSKMVPVSVRLYLMCVSR